MIRKLFRSPETVIQSSNEKITLSGDLSECESIGV